MAGNTYGKSVVEVVKFLLHHPNVWISDDEIIKISPQLGERIIDELIAYHVVESTKDGLCFGDDCVDALKKYLRGLGIKID